jgi:hypothetical protein
MIVFETKLVSYGKLSSQLTEIPKFSFDYDTIQFNTALNLNDKTYKNEQIILNQSEIQEITQFIQNYRFKVWRISANGTCDGQFYIDECANNLYAYCPPPNLPDNYYYDSETENWNYIHGVDVNGKYLGNVPYVQCTTIADKAPNFDYEKWDSQNKIWYDSRTLDDVKTDSINSMNSSIALLEQWGVLYQGVAWSIKNEDVTKLLNAPEDGSIVSWPDNDGNIVTFSGYTITDLKNATNNFLQEIETKRATTTAAINSANTIEDVLKVTL